MSPPITKSANTILQLLRARQLFIGDELNLRTLRVAWEESGQSAETFGQAMSHLRDQGFIRVVQSTAGPAVQLTHQGFQASQPAARSVPSVEATQRIREPVTPPPKRVPHQVSSTMPETLELPDLPEVDLPTPLPPPARRQTASRSQHQPDHAQDMAHARTFRTRSEIVNDNVLRHCVLGLMRHYRIKPNGQLGFNCVLSHWQEIGLSRADLLCALDLLIADGAIQTISEPQEKIVLTLRGFEHSHSAPSSMEDGMDRWRAKKRLRLTKHLGSLPAA